MKPLPSISADACRPFLSELEPLFDAMDREYERVAGRYGFTCTGCADNCCQTRFYHHTLLEFTYLSKGFRSLSETERGQITARAGEVVKQSEAADAWGDTIRLWCPLNDAGKCVLYPYRPMICRLHGIPHELRRPAQPPRVGPGCDDFHGQCGQGAYIRFDRTPFYARMAALERQLRQAVGCSDRLKLTVAEMILQFP
ncbi:hypothetical protein D3OALGA1CA_3110 [Olavius algarvensis associated proteobacterium Delta 3]|nr:hypothetical protein D3OALGA1CA_3110 [Olavius algarvensis associated proteobacterium Delta 3]CAB5158802.1 hypothetical protein D3OALGB2SA_5293 [Olavius algarvensis associated proteobacterium Delta 3]